MNFIGDPESARLTINDWTAKQTRQKIRDLIPPGFITGLTCPVLTNAIYFKAMWDKPFDPAATQPDDFHLANNRTKKIPMMHQTNQFAYAETSGLQILEMPYAGKNFSLVILLPRKDTNLVALEFRLANGLGNWLAALSPSEVIVTVPKFEMTMAMSLKDTLKRMGMPLAFTPLEANFTGIDDGRDKLFIGEVIHKAFVEVSETGTEAAAATAVVSMPSTAPNVVPPTPTPEFTADRPFVYLVRDRQTGDILFLGRFVGK